MRSIRCLLGIHDWRIPQRTVGKSIWQETRDAGMVLKSADLNVFDVPVREKLECARCEKWYQRTRWEAPAPDLPEKP